MTKPKCKFSCLGQCIESIQAHRCLLSAVMPAEQKPMPTKSCILHTSQTRPHNPLERLNTKKSNHVKRHLKRYSVKTCIHQNDHGKIMKYLHHIGKPFDHVLPCCNAHNGNTRNFSIPCQISHLHFFVSGLTECAASNLDRLLQRCKCDA